MKLLRFFFSTKTYPHTGLLILRITAGMYMLLYHGWAKVLAGPASWERLGGALTKPLGIEFLSLFFGFSAMLAESLGAFLIALGLWTRTASFFLAFTMLVAVLKKLPKGAKEAELPALFLCICLLTFLAGAGKYSLDQWRNSKNTIQ